MRHIGCFARPNSKISLRRVVSGVHVVLLVASAAKIFSNTEELLGTAFWSISDAKFDTVLNLPIGG